MNLNTQAVHFASIEYMDFGAIAAAEVRTEGECFVDGRLGRS